MADADTPPVHVSADSMAWETSPSYPDALQQVVRWKILAGGNLFGGAIGIPQKDAMMGVLDLDAGGYYPAHAHPAPEFYYIISGTAKWTVGGETFTATPGMAIYHAPNVPHRMVNHGPEPLHTLWFWWAPDCDTDVFNGKITLLEDMPAPPDGEDD